MGFKSIRQRKAVMAKMRGRGQIGTTPPMFFVSKFRSDKTGKISTTLTGTLDTKENLLKEAKRRREKRGVKGKVLEFKKISKSEAKKLFINAKKGSNRSKKIRTGNLKRTEAITVNVK